MYKSQLVKGKTLVDLTGGYGIDSYYFSKVCEQVTHIELNETLSSIASHNFKELNVTNINCLQGDSIELIRDKKFDTIYIDPSRRNDIKGKVFYLNDCLPNVPKHIDYLLERCNTLIIKTSPMLDLSVGLEELKNVIEIHCVALKNEVKEILWVLGKESSQNIKVHTVNITKNNIESFKFQLNNEANASYSLPAKYLYEPNAAILKSGAFQEISQQLLIDKLHVHSHLYTSEQLIDFPGRRFLIKEQVAYNKKEMKAIKQLGNVHITTRNFPETVAIIRKKWKLKEGGTTYLFFTTLLDNKKVVLICDKV